MHRSRAWSTKLAPQPGSPRSSLLTFSGPSSPPSLAWRIPRIRAISLDMLRRIAEVLNQKLEVRFVPNRAA